MKQYTEVGSVYSKGHHGTYTEVYTQARWRHLFARIYYHYTLWFMRVLPWKKIEKIDQWWHERSCNDDCMTGEVWRRGQGSKIETYCAHMPFTCRQDCRYYDLSMKGRTRVSYRQDGLAEDVSGRVGSKGPSQPL